MRIINQGENTALEGRSILNTELTDKKGNKITIDTTFLGGKGSQIDRLFEGDTTGEIEMMIQLNGKWINRSQRRYDTRKEALKDHKTIVKNFIKNGTKEILKFKEICRGGRFLEESDEELKDLIKVKE